MAKHNETGIKGEALAEEFLQKKGYNILFRNWRSGRMEVDIIAESGGLLVFVEVKTRAYSHFGYPEEAVGYKKQDMLKTAAEEFTYLNPGYKEVRFDIVSIIANNNNLEEIIHLEDAFY